MVFSMPLLQLHLVHWNSESHPSFKDAVGSGDPNGLCVLGFFLEVTYVGDPSFKAGQFSLATKPESESKSESVWL